jgi:hypothetical protein
LKKYVIFPISENFSEDLFRKFSLISDRKRSEFPTSGISVGISENFLSERKSENATKPPDTPVLVPTTILKWTPDSAALHPLFSWLSPKITQKTFDNTMQYACIPCCTLLKHALKSPNPALNVIRCNEPIGVLLVTLFMQIPLPPAIHDGSTSAVNFVGVDMQVTDVYGIKTDKQFVNMLED